MAYSPTDISAAAASVVPEIGRDYLGPHGWLFRVEAIEHNDGYPLVVIRQSPPQNRGTIRFPLEQAAKWLKPVG